MSREDEPNLNDLVTKAQQQDDGLDPHQAHYQHTLQALEYIRSEMTFLRLSEIEQDKFVNLPRSVHKKVLILDMDETLIHCVDDIQTQNPDVILEIDFPGEEIVCAGINLRPFVLECLREATEIMQVVVFTASHQVYADAILDHLDPDKTLFSHRMYRQHCVQTPEGYYVKDLRVILNRDLKDMVLVDNSVYSFAYQVDNGIPIISYYDNPDDEELLHLMFYIKSIVDCDDVRRKNRNAFELYKLGLQEDQEECAIEEARSSDEFEDLVGGPLETYNFGFNSDLTKTLKPSEVDF